MRINKRYFSILIQYNYVSSSLRIDPGESPYIIYPTLFVHTSIDILLIDLKTAFKRNMTLRLSTSLPQFFFSNITQITLNCLMKMWPPLNDRFMIYDWIQISQLSLAATLYYPNWRPDYEVMVISHFTFTKRSVVIFHDVLIDTYHMSKINSNIQFKFISPISSRSSVPYMTLPYSLISTHSPTLLLTSRCIKLLVSVRLNLMIRTYLVEPYN